jgi:RimJ/RimL family protein N-acetyltransferase
VTEERTSKWIDNLVLKKEDRLLFMIDDIDNHHLGQIALANFDYEERRGCIDSACHGERGNVHDLMFFVFKTLSRWMVSRLGAEEICLKTNTDNFRALNLYHRIGFHEIKEVPLFRRDLGDEIRWDPEPNRNPVEAERSEYIMQLDMTTL